MSNTITESKPKVRLREVDKFKVSKKSKFIEREKKNKKRSSFSNDNSSHEGQGHSKGNGSYRNRDSGNRKESFDSKRSSDRRSSDRRSDRGNREERGSYQGRPDKDQGSRRGYANAKSSDRRSDRGNREERGSYQVRSDKDQGARRGYANAKSSDRSSDRGNRAERGSYQVRSDKDHGSRRGYANAKSSDRNSDRGNRAERGSYQGRSDKDQGSRKSYSKERSERESGKGRQESGKYKERRSSGGRSNGSSKRNIFSNASSSSSETVTYTKEQIEMLSKDNFADLGLGEKVVKRLNSIGYNRPTPIQALTIPEIIEKKEISSVDINEEVEASLTSGGNNINSEEGNSLLDLDSAKGDKKEDKINSPRDIIAQAQTGTGKTAAFALPIIDGLVAKKHFDKSPFALVLVPTRELALQVSQEIINLSLKGVTSVVSVYGGQRIGGQIQKIRSGANIVVATPGRLLDLLGRDAINLEKISYFIIDEADEMLNMGFIDDIEEIMEHTNDKKRTLLFSATMPKRIISLAKKYMKNHKVIVAKKINETNNLIEQMYFQTKESKKQAFISKIIDSEDGFYGIIFCKTKRDVDSLGRFLRDRNYKAAVLHGDIPQQKRERVIIKIKNKQVNIVVATDVAARGVNIPNLTHVINYAIAQCVDSYTHRIGRTGRAGNKGKAITFITESEKRKLDFISKELKVSMKPWVFPETKDLQKAENVH